jgi:hypothetical protein
MGGSADCLQESEVFAVSDTDLESRESSHLHLENPHAVRGASSGPRRGGRLQPGHRDFDQAEDSLIGHQTAGRFQGMKAVPGELVRGNIGAENSRGGTITQYLGQEFMEMQMGATHMGPLVQPCGLSTPVMGLGDHPIGLQDGFKFSIRTYRAVTDLRQMFQVGLNLTFVPGGENVVHVRKVFV